MAKKFYLDITLGNEGMNTPFGIAAALKKAAHTITIKGLPENDTFIIKDINCNTVGHYGIKNGR